MIGLVVSLRSEKVRAKVLSHSWTPQAFRVFSTGPFHIILLTHPLMSPRFRGGLSGSKVSNNLNFFCLLESPTPLPPLDDLPSPFFSGPFLDFIYVHKRFFSSDKGRVDSSFFIKARPPCRLEDACWFFFPCPQPKTFPCTDYVPFPSPWPASERRFVRDVAIVCYGHPGFLCFRRDPENVIRAVSV